jgi:hypothetical protein
MASIIIPFGIVSYNGYQFDGASHVTIRCEPHYDDAQRTVVYHKYTISVKAVIADSGGTGLSLADIRNRLTKAGQSLIVSNQGFYNLYANVASPDGYINDVAFGPKPRVLSWTPIGSAYACEIDWEVETCISYCALPQYYSGIMAFNYQVTYAIDFRGLTVRTISGYYEIAMTRTLYTIPDTADAYRTFVSPRIPTRFQRTSQNWNISLDKRRMDFSVVDTELPSNNPYPNGVVSIDAKHSVRWSRNRGWTHLWNTINVDIEMAPDQPMLNAYAAFAAIVKKRVDIARAAYTSGVFLDDLSAEEHLFSRRCSFSVSYRILSELKQFLADSGLWTPLSTNTWEQWAFSIANITDQRGYANLQHVPTNDAIVDPCGSTPSIPWDVTSPKPLYPQDTRLLLKNETPTVDKSWLDYQCVLMIERERAVVRHAILQTPEEDDPKWNQNSGEQVNYPATAGDPDIAQRSGQARYYARLVGLARRAGYPIPKPAITAVGLATATESGGDFKTWLESNALGVSVYAAEWDIMYTLDKPPGNVLPITNVAQGVTDVGVANPPAGP